MKIIDRPIDSITPYENNPRINDQAVEAVAASIKEFGWNVPIVCDENWVVIAGHTRLKAARLLGLSKVPVYVAKGLTPDQIRAYRLADNATPARSQWDDERLTKELLALQSEGFDLDLTGFSGDDLLRLLNSEPVVGLTDPDDVPAPPDEATTQSGDLWILGDHRLLCGDSSEAEDVNRLLDGAQIHLVNSDPPYGVRVEPRSNNAIAAGLSSFQGPKHHQKMDVVRHPEKAKPTGKKLRAKDRPLANDFLSDDEFDKLLDAWFANFSRALLPGHGFFVWGGYANLGNYPPFLKKHGLYFSQGIVWDKEHPVLTRKDFMGAFEICFYGWREGAAHRFFGPNYRRLKDPEFKSQLQAARQEMVERTANMLTAASTESVKTLLRLQSDPAPHAVQLGAAKAIVELGTKLRENAELFARVASLEAQLMAGA